MIYFVPILLLVLTVSAFFVVGRQGLRSFGGLQIALRVLVVLPLVISGVAHFFLTPTFAAMVPPIFVIVNDPDPIRDYL